MKKRIIISIILIQLTLILIRVFYISGINDIVASSDNGYEEKYTINNNDYSEETAHNYWNYFHSKGLITITDIPTVNFFYSDWDFFPWFCGAIEKELQDPRRDVPTLWKDYPVNWNEQSNLDLTFFCT